MNLLSHIKTLKAEKRLELAQNCQLMVSDNPLDLYTAFSAYLEKHIGNYLAALTEIEALIFYYTCQKPGFELESIENLDSEVLKEGLRGLKEKGLVYSRISVQKVNPVTRITLLDEVHDILSKKLSFYTEKALIEKLQATRSSSVLSKYADMPFELFSYFYSYGLICRKHFLEQQAGKAAIEYFLGEGLIHEALVVSHSNDGAVFYPCYELITEKIEANDFNVVRSISYQTRIFNDIIRLIYIITREDILITKKGDVNKRHYDKLIQEIGSENIVWFLLRFLMKHNFVEVDQEDSYIQLSEKGTAFFQQDIEDVYRKILETDPMMQEIFDLVKSMHSADFGLADIVLAYLKKEVKSSLDSFLLRDFRRQVIKYVEILSYMGILIQKFSGEGFVVYSVNPHYKNIVNEKGSGKKALVVSPSMEVTVYPQELDLQTSYILNVFMEPVSFSDVFIYQITPQSVKRAIYFGFKSDLLLSTLQSKARNEISSNVAANLQRWEEQFESGHISREILLEAPEEILDRLEHHPEYRNLMKKRLNNTYALMSDEIYKNRILEELSIYLYVKK